MARGGVGKPAVVLKNGPERKGATRLRVEGCHGAPLVAIRGNIAIIRQYCLRRPRSEGVPWERTENA